MNKLINLISPKPRFIVLPSC